MSIYVSVGTTTMIRKTLISLLLTLGIFRDCQGAQTCCADGWLPFQGTCYYIGHGGTMNFIDSEHFCQQHGAELVIVGSPEQDKFLKNFVLRLKGERDYWIGISDMDNEGQWVIHGTNETLEFVDWYPGQPDQHMGVNEDCAVFSTHPQFHGRWHDIPCGSKGVPVCQKTPPPPVVTTTESQLIIG